MSVSVRASQVARDAQHVRQVDDLNRSLEHLSADVRLSLSCPSLSVLRCRQHGTLKANSAQLQRDLDAVQAALRESERQGADAAAALHSLQGDYQQLQVRLPRLHCHSLWSCVSKHVCW